MQLPEIITVSEQVLVQELGNESIMLNMHDGYYYTLDGIGTRIWQLMAEEKSVAEIIDQMLVEYDVDEDSLRRDLAELLEKLLATGAITT